MTTAPDTTAGILIVDDMEENLVALEAVLGSLSQHVVRARSGEEALKAMLREEFAVVLIDVLMPGMNGFETAANIKGLDQTKDVPIILLTGASVDPNYAYRGYTVGAADFLVKPFDPWLLRTKVNVFLELHRKNRQLAAQADQLKRLLTSQEGAGDLAPSPVEHHPEPPQPAGPPALGPQPAQPAPPVDTVELPDTPVSAEAPVLPAEAAMPADTTVSAETAVRPEAPVPPEATTPSEPPTFTSLSSVTPSDAATSSSSPTSLTSPAPPEPPALREQDALTTTGPGEAAQLAEIVGQLTEIEVLLRDTEGTEPAGLADRIAGLEQAVGRLLVSRGT